jgi:uncharacterized protein
MYLPSSVRAIALATLALVGCIGTIGPASAIEHDNRPSVPILQGRVNDYANLLTSQERARLAADLTNYEKETSHQIAVLTVPSLNGESIEKYSLRVANTWKLGQNGLNNGVILTVAPTERLVRIELGSGMNRFVSDSDAQRIIDETMLPQFREGHLDKGIILGIERLMLECRAYKVRGQPGS